MWLQRAVRLSALEKGGAVGRLLAVPSELVEPLPQRAVGHAKLFGDILRGSPVDEHGAKCFVAAVMRIAWLSEERAAGRVVHDPYSLKMSMSFVEEPGQIVNPREQRRPDESASNRVKTDFWPIAVVRSCPRYDATRRGKPIDS
jgi:hypothetical protein